MAIVNISSDQAFNTPTQVELDLPSVKVTKVLIPLTNSTAQVKYFVDSKSGDSFGSYNNLDDAIELAHEMDKLL